MNKQLLVLIPFLFVSFNAFALLNINTATVEEIESLDAMGAVSAQYLVDCRTKHGHFKTIDEVNNLLCITPEKFKKIKDHISIRDQLFYKVLKGDTLSKIAREQLGRHSKYPAIFKLNQSTLRHPDKIYPGQLLLIPAK